MGAREKPGCAILIDMAVCGPTKFSPQETELALDGYDGQGMRVEDLLGAALRRLGMEA